MEQLQLTSNSSAVHKPELQKEQFRSLGSSFDFTPIGLYRALFTEKGHTNDLTRSRTLLKDLYRKIENGLLAVHGSGQPVDVHGTAADQDGSPLDVQPQIHCSH